MNVNPTDHSRIAASRSRSTDSADTLAASPQSSTFSNSTSNETAGSSMPATIPTQSPYRTLVLCFDGTGDQFDEDNSNIVHFFSLLKKDDPSKQLVYYQAGIGTYIPQIVTPLYAKISKTIDECIGWNLDAHIMSGYEFLMQNYAANDRICIFGFSRGAYTARCLAGMIHKVGLLPICNHQQVPFAYKMYKRADDFGWKQSSAFKKAFSIDVDIEFLGVWDSVNSVGLIPRRLPFTTSNRVVRTFRHAVSLDERRARFKENLWNRPLREEKLPSVTDKKVAKKVDKKKRQKGYHKDTLLMLENKYGKKDRQTATDVDEVWFSGCHCDVGGGSVNNGVVPCLARIPLRWMIRECFRTNSGITFRTDGMREIGLDPATLHPTVLTRPPAITMDPSLPKVYIARMPKTPELAPDETTDELEEEKPEQVENPQTEEEADFADALAPIYDQLSMRWGWWFLEVLPMSQRYLADNHKWVSKWFGWNLGRGRSTPGESSNGVRVHRSVKARLEAEHKDGKKYLPKANLDLAKVTWVD